MKILKRLFFWKRQKRDQEEIIEMSQAIRPIVDEITMEIFSLYREVLLTEEITFIVPAVWGASKGGELTRVQREIHERVEPAVRRVVDSLKLKRLSPAQDFALGFLVRDLLITKIVYLIESCRNHILARPGEGAHDLRRVEPAGSA